MRDLCGNVLTEGQLVLWRPAGFTGGSGVIGTIIHIEEPVLATADERPAQVVLAIPITVGVPHGQSLATPRLDDLICIVNPQQQDRMAAILAGNPSRKDGMPQ